jgi:penicillin-binding protein 2
MVVMLLLILTRLIRIQFLQFDHYVTLSRENRVKILPIPPVRGAIYSRDGVLLAENRTSFSLEVIPGLVKDLDAVFKELQPIVAIGQDDIDRFHRLIRQKRLYESVPLRFNLNEVEVSRFAVNRHRFPGIDVAVRLTRFYPQGELMSHVVGYVGRVDVADLRKVSPSNYSGTSHIGKTGVEKNYETILHGNVGYQQVEVNAQGRILRVLDRTPPESGKNLYLSVHVGFQSYAREVLGDRNGAIVAMEIDTGEVIAMVSSPSYDPNPFVNGITSERYAELRNSPRHPLFNRAIQGKYPPGSTIKPFVGLAGLEYGLRKPSDTTWCRGWYELPGQEHKYRCWDKGGHGNLDLKASIAESCDVYFYRLAQDLGIDRIHDYLSRFGLGRRTNIDLPGEAAGLLPSRDWKRLAKKASWFPGETLITGIGQGYMLATPLQLAAATAMLAGHGASVQPTIIDHFESPDTHRETTIRTQTRLESLKISNEHWTSILESMEEVVHGRKGTARKVGKDAPYRFAGKTGTSQVFGIKQDETVKQDELEEHLRDHALFIAFAPYEKPEIAVAVVVEHGGGGSETAAPIARQLFDWYFKNIVGREAFSSHG